MIRTDNEKELIARLRDPTLRRLAFPLLIEAYQKRLYYHLRTLLKDHDDTDDALQSTFIKAWENLDKFREDAKLFTWLYRIATNEGLMLIKKRRGGQLVSFDSEELEYFEPSENLNPVQGETIQRRLEEALDRLPEKQRLVFQMKYFEEMKYEDMSEILGTSVGALKASYHHAVKKLEIILGKS